MGWLFRRSGIAVGLVANALNWEPDQIWQVGVGFHYHEIKVLVDGWKLDKSQVVGFEANPIIYGKIIDEFPGTLVNLAMGSKPGTGILKYKHRHKDGSTLKELDDFDTEVEVCTETLDRVHLALSSVSTRNDPLADNILLWLDCEGSEYDVLLGAEEFIKRVKVVNVEMTMKPFGKGWCKPIAVHQWLLNRGFRLQHIHTHRLSVGQFDAVFVRSELFKTEYCCCFYEMARQRLGEEK